MVKYYVQTIFTSEADNDGPTNDSKETPTNQPEGKYKPPHNQSLCADQTVHIKLEGDNQKQKAAGKSHQILHAYNPLRPPYTTAKEVPDNEHPITIGDEGTPPFSTHLPTSPSEIHETVPRKREITNSPAPKKHIKK